MSMEVSNALKQIVVVTHVVNASFIEDIHTLISHDV